MVRQEPHPPKQWMDWAQAMDGLGKVEENMFRGVASPSRAIKRGEVEKTHGQRGNENENT